MDSRTGCGEGKSAPIVLTCPAVALGGDRDAAWAAFVRDLLLRLAARAEIDSALLSADLKRASRDGAFGEWSIRLLALGGWWRGDGHG